MAKVTDPCAECGFTYNLSRPLRSGRSSGTEQPRWRLILRNRDIDVRSRSQQGVWSPLSTGAIYEMCADQAGARACGATRESGCLYAHGGEERVQHDGYDEQDPDDVARQLVDAATLFANVLARLDDHGWDRTSG